MNAYCLTCGERPLADIQQGEPEWECPDCGDILYRFLDS